MPYTVPPTRLRRTGLLATFAAAMLAAHGSAIADTITPGLDGPANTARINSNWKGLALAPSGEVVIADSGNNLIRRLSADYRQVTTVAGTLAPSVYSLHYADGNGPAAKFALPTAVAVDAAGNIYVADNGNQVVRKISPAGDVTTLAGQAGVCGTQDGVGQAATLCGPSSIVVDSAGTVYVAQSTPRATPTSAPVAGRIRKITADGVVSTFVGATSKYSSQLVAFHPDRSFANVNLAIDSAGTLYSADSNDHVIRKYAADGQATVLSGTEGMDTEGEADGAASVARFGNIVDFTIDRQDRLFVLDRRDWVTTFLDRRSIRRIDADGSVTTLVRSPVTCSMPVFPPAGSLCNARSMTVGAHGEFLVGELAQEVKDVTYTQLRSYTQQGTSTVVIGPGAVVPAPDVAITASLQGPLIDTRMVIDVGNVPAIPGQQLWLAVLHNSQLMFLGGNGFVTFQCPGACDAPANRAASGSPQRIEYPGLDVRGFIGAKIYIGWGRSFAEMVNTGQIREVHTVVSP